VRLAAAALVLALALAACGSSAPDLFEVIRSGGGPRLDLVTNDGGTATCDGREHTLPAKLLLRSRLAARDLADPAARNLHLAPGPGTVFTYRVRVQQGTVSFADSSRRVPKALAEVQLLTRDIAVQVCGRRQ
jgi:hypothetical protein